MAQKTLDMIIKFLEVYPEVRVICGHEWENFLNNWKSKKGLYRIIL
jgi:hypothetical protein